jgi:hypothetical protein
LFIFIVTFLAAESYLRIKCSNVLLGALATGTDTERYAPFE